MNYWRHSGVVVKAMRVSPLNQVLPQHFQCFPGVLVKSVDGNVGYGGPKCTATRNNRFFAGNDITNSLLFCVAVYFGTPYPTINNVNYSDTFVWLGAKRCPGIVEPYHPANTAYSVLSPSSYSIVFNRIQSYSTVFHRIPFLSSSITFRRLRCLSTPPSSFLRLSDPLPVTRTKLFLLVSPFDGSRRSQVEQR